MHKHQVSFLPYTLTSMGFYTHPNQDSSPFMRFTGDIWAEDWHLSKVFLFGGDLWRLRTDVASYWALRAQDQMQPWRETAQMLQSCCYSVNAPSSWATLMRLFIIIHGNNVFFLNLIDILKVFLRATESHFINCNNLVNVIQHRTDMYVKMHTCVLLSFRSQTLLQQQRGRGREKMSDRSISDRVNPAVKQ